MEFKDVIMRLYPQRAKGVTADKVPWDDPNYQFEVKHDGDRRLVYLLNTGNKNTSRSKSKSTGRPVEKTNNVPHIRDFIIKELHGTVLDCEFTHNRGFTNGVRKIMGCLPEKAIERQQEWGYIDVQLFDIICYKGNFINHWPYKERRGLLEIIYNEYFKNNPHFNIVEQVNGTPEEKQERLNEIIDSGGEGMVAKNINSNYRLSTEKCMSPLKNAWIKVKREFNGDFIVTGFEPSTVEYIGDHLDTHMFWESIDGDKLTLNGIDVAKEYEEENDTSLIPITKYHYYNWIGGLTFSEYRDGKIVEVGTVSSGLSEELRAVISSNPNKYFGKVIEIDAMERDKKSFALRHPVFVRFRDDKEVEDCQYELQKG